MWEWGSSLSKILIGNIVDNKVICPICNENTKLSSPRDYDTVRYNNSNMILFTSMCINCDNSVQYLSDISMEGN